MSKETTSLYLQQGNLHLSVGGVTQEEIDKMEEIRKRDPEGTWDMKEVSLLNKAQEELKAAKA